MLAARLMYEREESEYFSAKRKAARQLGVDYKYRPKDLPSNSEVRDQIQSLAQFYEGDARNEHLRTCAWRRCGLCGSCRRFGRG